MHAAFPTRVTLPAFANLCSAQRASNLRQHCRQRAHRGLTGGSCGGPRWRGRPPTAVPAAVARAARHAEHDDFRCAAGLFCRARLADCAGRHRLTSIVLLHRMSNWLEAVDTVVPHTLARSPHVPVSRLLLPLVQGTWRGISMQRSGSCCWMRSSGALFTSWGAHTCVLSPAAAGSR